MIFKKLSQDKCTCRKCLEDWRTSGQSQRETRDQKKIDIQEEKDQGRLFEWTEADGVIKSDYANCGKQDQMSRRTGSGLKNPSIYMFKSTYRSLDQQSVLLITF